MSEPRFDIHISTSADTKGVEQAKQALAELSRETKQLTTASDEQKTAARESVAAVEEEISVTKELTAAQEAQAESAKAQAESAKEQSEATKEQETATKKADTATQSNIRTLATMEAELEELTTAMKNMDVASEGFTHTRDKVNKLGGEIENLKSGGSPLAGSMDKARNAIQGVSDVLDGTEEGIQGVLGSLPGLVAAFGGKAGLVSGVGLATTALSLLIKQMSKLDYDGTWVGDFQEGFRELVTGMTDAEREAKEIAEAPASWAKTVEEELEESYNRAEEALRGEIKLLEKKLELQKSVTAQKLEEAEYNEKLFKLQNPNDAETGTQEWAATEWETKKKEWETREASRVKDIKDAENEKLSADDVAKKLTADATEARKKADDLRKREDYVRNIAANKQAAEEAERKMRSLEGADARHSNQWKEQQKIAKAARSESERNQKMLLNPDLYSPQAGETAGGMMKVADEKEAAAKQAREQAAEKTSALERAKETSRKQWKLNEEQLKSEKASIEKAVKERQQEEANERSEAERKAAVDKARDNLQLAQLRRPPDLKEGTQKWRDYESNVAALQHGLTKAENEKRLGDILDRNGADSPEYQRAKEESDRGNEINDATLQSRQKVIQHRVTLSEQNEKRDQLQGKLTPDMDVAPGPADASALEVVNSQMRKLAGKTQNQEILAQLEALFVALNDKEGDQAAELSIMQELLTRIAAEKDGGKNASMVQQALQLMQQQQADGSRMEQVLTQVLNGLIGNQRDLRTMLEQMKIEVDILRENNRR